ncbi:MAG: MarR family transcriptional regulator, partial [Proteobacteria bacterium]|nr:MarR family transcriptional regulator [Pseudomonadota bacterium]
KLRLSFQHWRVLAVLARDDGVSIADLSEYAVVPHSTLSRLLTRLERENLVRRSAQTPDGRTARILLSARGRTVYERILPLAIARREDALFGVTEVEKAQLRTLLKRMLANLKSAAHATRA